MGGSLIPKDEKKKAKDGTDMTPLLHAVSKGDKDLVRKLLEKGDDIRAQDKNDRTVLHLAMKSSNSSEDKIRLLLKSNRVENMGLDLDAADNEKNTALHKCADWNKGSIAKLLLYYGACPEVQDADGKTPLYSAIHGDYSEVVEALLDGGANISEEYFSITKSSHVKKLLLSKIEETREPQPKKEATRRRNSRKMSFPTISISRRGSNIKA